MTSKGRWKTSFSVTLIVVLLSISPFAAAQDGGWLHYEPAVVTLRGKLTMIVKYGPPNYGEDPERDSVEHPIILILPLPIRVQGDPNSELNSETVTNIGHVQLVIYTGVAAGYSRYFGRNVEVTGSLMKSFSGHHHTDVLLIVKTLKPVGGQNSNDTNALLSAGPPQPAKKGMPKGWVPHKPGIARLEGNLTAVIKYGPPNYGDPQTDEKLFVPMLSLPWPAIVDEITDNVTYIQLIFPNSIAYRRYLDGAVRVSGTLSEASARDHFTKVIMEVKSIEAITTKK